MKLISWNVNGLRSIYKKGFKEEFNKLNADIFCVQETKMQEGQLQTNLDGYFEYYNYADQKGYSGTGVFTKTKPINISYGIGIEKHDKEGRVITAEFEKFYLVNCYTPNSGRELVRLEYRMEWEEDFKKYLINLDKTKPVILCGDLNVAHKEIDLKNPKTNRHNAGFTDEERDKIDKLIKAGFTDSYRKIYPEKQGAYTWWSYMRNARNTNAGWRIDYFLVSDRISKDIKDAYIYSDIMGSDHCPVGLEIY